MQDNITLDTLAIEAQARAMRAAYARHLVQSLMARLRRAPEQEARAATA